MGIHANGDGNIVNRVRAEKLTAVHLPGVQNLASQGKHGLEFFVAPLLGGTACRVPFHNEEFVAANIIGFAIGEFPRKHCHSRGFALFVLRRLALASLRLRNNQLGKLFAFFDMVV